ncbi:phosphotransferase [Devosia sp. YIM 151766]|uniref:phosphotransferase family protein n=1 Tax=Devosia sp. YIM 151766 TaxID=3017325 RepID=UPI00255D0A8F|nr:phosphotransferase [Devosia sp. YIM 151766]WIY53526.1 phosphotransferase [Devosia sp. YIM 151766]
MLPLPSDREILARLGHPDAPLLGSGGEAQVYALDPGRVARIMRPGADLATATARQDLSREIAAGARHLPFLTPRIAEVLEIDGRVLAIEALLPGAPVAQLLLRAAEGERRALMADYLETASAISTIGVERPAFGPLLGGEKLQASSWNGFLRARLLENLSACPNDLRTAVEAAAGTALPEPESAALVHLDYFPANVLAEGSRISAVLDFGPSALIGDARMEAWSAVAYLDPELSPAATEADRAQAMDWLAARDLVASYAPAKRWLAAYWSFATDDAALMAWCRRILLS